MRIRLEVIDRLLPVRSENVTVIAMEALIDLRIRTVS